jgi:ATP-dependent RNA helicase RhlE
MELAQTRTGRTAAFVLPLLERLMKGPSGSIRALVITPTCLPGELSCDNVDFLDDRRLRQ